MLIIMDNPNLDKTTQEYYNRLFEEYSKINYRMNPEKMKYIKGKEFKKEDIDEI